MPIVVDVASNHLGKLDRAKEMIKIAADCGADFVKFQMFKQEDYPHNIVTPKEWLKELVDSCNKYGIGYMHSVFYYDVELLFSSKFIKIAFSQRYNFSLQNYYNKAKLIVSGNGRTEWHIKDCIKLYCVPKYPANIEDYKNYWKNPDDFESLPSTGFDGVSDHTIGTKLYAKYRWYEKHLKLGDSEEARISPDAGEFAITPKELEKLCAQ